MTITRSPNPIRCRGELVKLGRYRTPTGERWLVGRRVDGTVGLVDTPAPGTPGIAYLVDQDFDSRAELIAVVREYLNESRTTGAPAMANGMVAEAIAAVAGLLDT